MAKEFFIWGDGVTAEEKRKWAVEQLQRMQQSLGRTPHKDDFDEPTRARIKAFLGPWPRALEAAGLKEPRPATRRKTARPTNKKGDLT